MSEPVTVALDVADVAPHGATVQVGDLFLPPGAAAEEGETGGRPVDLVVCLPGGGMTRRYYDLPEALPGRWSMARHLVDDHGLAVLTLDHLGVGDSASPDDPYTLTPRVVAACDARAVEVALAGLRSGDLVHGLAPVAVRRVVGVGHSMGGMVVAHQQARHRSYDAIALLGFGGEGLPDHLNDDERGYAGDLDELELALPALVAARFGTALPRPSGNGGTATSSFLTIGVTTPGALELARQASGALLALNGLTSMIPGTTDAALRAIDVPVFLGVGEHDIVTGVERLPTLLERAPSVELFVLPGAGHNHVIADNRTEMFDAVGRWVEGLGG